MIRSAIYALLIGAGIVWVANTLTAPRNYIYYGEPHD